MVECYSGLLIAMSIIHSGSGCPFIAPTLYSYICGQNSSEIPIEIDDIPDADVRNQTNTVLVVHN